MPYTATPIANVNDSADMPRGKVCELDLDARQRERQAHQRRSARVLHLHRASVVPLMPAGLDQQGRYATRAPAPAEACTDLGAEPRSPAPRVPRPPRHASHPDRGLGLLLALLVPLLLVAGAAALVLVATSA